MVGMFHCFCEGTIENNSYLAHTLFCAERNSHFYNIYVRKKNKFDRVKGLVTSQVFTCSYSERTFKVYVPHSADSASSQIITCNTQTPSVIREQSDRWIYLFGYQLRTQADHSNYLIEPEKLSYVITRLRAYIIYSIDTFNIGQLFFLFSSAQSWHV